MKISNIEILIGSSVGTDKISLITNLPSPFPNGISNPTLIVNFESQKGNGIEYVKENFKDVPIRVINTNNGLVTML